MRFMLFLIMLTFAFETKAQTYVPTENDTIIWLQNALGSSNWNGKKVDDLLDAFDKNNVKIQYIRTAVTSPWIDPQGKSYTYRITLSFLSEDEVFLRFFNTKKLIPIVYIYLKEPLEERTEFNKRPLYDRRFSIKDRVRMVGSLLIKKVELDYMKM